MTRNLFVAAALVACGLGSAVVHAASPVCANPAPAIAQGGVMQDPAVAAAVNGLAAAIEADRQAGRIASVSVAVVHDQTVLFAAAFGCANLARNEAATPDTVYSIGSVTKVFEATALMQQRDAGRLQLTDKVQKHVPQVWYLGPRGARVSPTFRELASHTAGLPDAMPSGLRTVAELYQRVEKMRAKWALGSKYAYSDVSFVVLGQAVTHIAGQNYHEYMKQHIFTPLGMTNTAYELDTLKGRQIAGGYTSLQQAGTGWTGTDAGIHDPFPPSGSILSTSNDMAKFIMLHFRDDRAVLPAADFVEMQKPIAPTGSGGQVGIGWFLQPYKSSTLVVKNGGVAGFTSQLYIYPPAKLGAVVLINETAKLTQPKGSAVIERIIFDKLVPVLPKA
jgi:CubicO group peptidase (beta-lactamase class C family)